ncbi:class I adenylate-forming enzyme family protein [Rhodopseudomonas pseudopalustris]|uniref:3-methylmercaptopropionyl-CoA ligase n=1 Tax=Rhodopseudomonas pseudopalustris TaxID=1513892 RepID=A0A1H8NJI3_9BRAD|nr:long-chain fatty acid--CoA ligase [Rhodopseudomonas pseudopalustris]SEO29726.1 Acyl-CoA synthetase (AMP-forming)/AMP-acid ligase II [Rhodopseudomonas pseudopalustris]
MQLTSGLRKATAFRADQTAIVAGERSFTHGELLDRVSRLASAFRAFGVGTGDRVAILAANGHPYVECYFAVLWAGGVVVPVNSRFALAEMIEQVNDAEPSILVCDRSFADVAVQIGEACSCLTAIVAAAAAAGLPGVYDYESAVANAEPCDDAGRGGEDLACLFYTGGTTGRSKGVMLSHRNLWVNAVVTAMSFGFDESTVALHAGPLFHLGAGARVYTTSIMGGRHVVIPRFAPTEVLEAISRHKVTVATFVPTMLGMILQLPDLDSYDLSSLKLITYGASPMPEAVLQECLRRFPSIKFGQSYGMTELSPVATILAPDDHLPSAPRRRLRSAGRPIVSAEVKVVDAEDRELKRGEVGEIVVRGPMVMMGYWRKPELTAEALRGGWMHTGDSGSFDADGYLYISDRIKDMIISGGENVYSIEVENAVLTHPEVMQCAVIGIPHPKWGEAVHAVVVRRPGSSLSAEELIAFCRSAIADYKSPRSVEFRDDPLPLSSVNKVNKAALRQPYWKDKPQPPS